MAVKSRTDHGEYLVRGSLPKITAFQCFWETSVVRSSVGYVTQDDIMYETLTPRENLSFAAAFILPKLSSDSRRKEVGEAKSLTCFEYFFIFLLAG